MENSFKGDMLGGVLSPRPRGTKAKFGKEWQNPFLDRNCLDKDSGEEKTVTELRKILNCWSSPVSKKNASPFCVRDRPPARQKINPIIFDARFIEINNSASTCEDSVSSLS